MPEFKMEFERLLTKKEKETLCSVLKSKDVTWEDLCKEWSRPENDHYSVEAIVHLLKLYVRFLDSGHSSESFICFLTRGELLKMGFQGIRKEFSRKFIEEILRQIGQQGIAPNDPRIDGIVDNAADAVFGTGRCPAARAKVKSKLRESGLLASLF